MVKEVHGAGGYGMLIGPAATQAEIEDFRQQIIATPERYIAQPTLALSTCPTFAERGLAPRHIDLRPFVLSGSDVTIVPGGLTRVALREGSLVVNSSQGGGTKDTWVLEELQMLSRTADHLYWMSRYIERAESLARLRRCALPDVAAAAFRRQRWPQSLSATMIALHMEEAYRERHDSDRAARGVRVPEPRPRPRGSIVQLPARGPRERARRARLAHLRAVGDPELHLARTRALRRAAHRSAGHRADSSNGSKSART